MSEIRKSRSQIQKNHAASIKTANEKPVEKKSVHAKSASRRLGIKKQYIKNKNVCRVTFKLPKAATLNGEKVCLVGDFNNWNTNAHPMKRLKSGDSTTSLDLDPGKEYHFRYLIGESQWENDWNADKYARSP